MAAENLIEPWWHHLDPELNPYHGQEGDDSSDDDSEEDMHDSESEASESDEELRAYQSMIDPSW